MNVLDGILASRIHVLVAVMVFSPYSDLPSSAVFVSPIGLLASALLRMLR